MVNIACVGAGYWGKNLVRNFANLGCLHTVCDGNHAVLENYTTIYPECNVTNSIHDVLSDTSIDALCIATPAETHADLIEQALIAGKHVYVEKPLCLDEKKAENLMRLSQEKGLVLMVGHLLQYHSAYIELKRMVVSGEIGDLRYIYSNRLNMGLLRKEENVLWSFAPHDISMILGLTGVMPKDITAKGSTYLTKGVADIVTANLEFDDNVSAHIFVSWLNPFKEQRLIVVGETGMLVFDDALPWSEKLIRYNHKVSWNEGVPYAEKADGEAVALTQSEPLRNECEHFLDSVKKNKKPRTDAEEGLRVLKVLNQIQASMC